MGNFQIIFLNDSTLLLNDDITIIAPRCITALFIACSVKSISIITPRALKHLEYITINTSVHTVDRKVHNAGVKYTHAPTHARTNGTRNNRQYYFFTHSLS